MSEQRIRAAYRMSVAAFIIAIAAMVVSTWWIPGAVASLNAVSDRLDRLNRLMGVEDVPELNRRN